MKKHRDNSDLIGVSDDIAAEMSAAELAKLFDVTARLIHILAEKGILARSANGRFDTADSIRRYLAFSRKGGNSDLDAAKLRVAEASAQKLELQNQIAAGAVLSVAEIEREWVSIVTDVRQAMLAVPSRLPELSLDLKMQLDAEIRSALLALSIRGGQPEHFAGKDESDG